MKSSYVWLSLAASALLCVACSIRLTESEEKRLLAREAERFAATVAADTALLRGYLSPQLHYTHSNGLVEDTQGHLENVGSQRIDYQSFEKVSQQRITTSGGTAYLRGIIDVTGLYEGTPFTVRLSYDSAYERLREGDWLLRRWVSTKVE